MWMFSRPVRFSSTAAYWPARPMVRRTASAWVTTSRPSTEACPESGPRMVERMRTTVVLPAPFGSEQPEDGAGLDLEGDAVERPHVAAGEDLHQIVGFHRQGGDAKN